MALEYVQIPGLGIDINYELERDQTHGKTWSALVERYVDGVLRPLPVTIDRATRAVTVPRGWTPVYRADDAGVIIALTRHETEDENA